MSGSIRGLREEFVDALAWCEIAPAGAEFSRARERVGTISRALVAALDDPPPKGAYKCPTCGKWREPCDCPRPARHAEEMSKIATAFESKYRSLLVTHEEMAERVRRALEELDAGLMSGQSGAIYWRKGIEGAMRILEGREEKP